MLVRSLRRLPNAIPVRMLAVVLAAMSVAMVAFPARGSNDVYSYAMYGRIASEHHANPYTALPDQFRKDPLFASVGPRWTHTPSRYGPLFTAISIVGTSLLPGERLPLRLFFQLLTAFGLGALLVLVWRRWRSPSALAFVGLHPLMMISVVNGAHNDIFVALGVFGFVMLLRRDRLVWAGLALAGAALVKATALLAVAAAALWLLTRRQVRDALTLVAVAVGAAVAGTVAVPGCAAAIRAAADLNLNSSIWYPFLLFATRHNTFPIHGPSWSVHHVEVFVKMPALFATMAALIAGVLLLRRRGDRNEDVAIAIGVATFSVFAAWVMPWYLIWALPLVAMSAGKIRSTMAAHGTVLLSVAHLHYFAHERLDVRTWLLLIVVPLLVVPVYGWAIWSDSRPLT